MKQRSRCPQKIADPSRKDDNPECCRAHNHNPGRCRSPGSPSRTRADLDRQLRPQSQALPSSSTNDLKAIAACAGTTPLPSSRRPSIRLQSTNLEAMPQTGRSASSASSSAGSRSHRPASSTRCQPRQSVGPGGNGGRLESRPTEGSPTPAPGPSSSSAPKPPAETDAYPSATRSSAECSAITSSCGRKSPPAPGSSPPGRVEARPASATATSTASSTARSSRPASAKRPPHHLSHPAPFHRHPPPSRRLAAESHPALDAPPSLLNHRAIRPRRRRSAASAVASEESADQASAESAGRPRPGSGVGVGFG